MKIYAYTDGASRNNPGRSASGFALLDARNKLIAEDVFYNGICTNNVAEYKAVIAALNAALKFGAGAEIVLVSDSRLIISQLAGRYKVKDKKLKRLNAEARRLLEGFEKHSLLNVSRENVRIAKVDRKLNELLDAVEEEDGNA